RRRAPGSIGRHGSTFRARPTLRAEPGNEKVVSELARQVEHRRQVPGGRPWVEGYAGPVRSLLVAAAVGVLMGLLAHELAVLLFMLGFVVVLAGLLLTLTAVGAVIGIPLMLVGAVEIVLGASSGDGAGPALVLGFLAALATYAHLRRRERRATA